MAFAGTLHAYERLQGPTQVTYWDRAKAYDGYTFFGAQGTTYLVDMEGRVVHTWPTGVNPRLLDSGSVLDAADGAIGGFTGLREIDWNGSNVWQYTESRAGYYPHHDFLRTWNKKLGAYTTLYLANKSISSNDCIAAGCNPASAPYTNVTVDAVVEVDASGTVVWEWCFFDHGCQSFDAGKSNYVANVSSAPGRINLNLAGRPLTNDWLHAVSLDFNTNLDQVVVSVEGGEFYVIDHGNTFAAGDPAASIALAASTAGDFLYRFGDPARHGAGSTPSIQLNWTKSTTGQKQIGGVSQATWIPPGVPGAGRFLVFNNGQDLFETTPQSYIFEVNGYLNSATNDTGAYVNPPSAGYTTWAPPGHDTDKQNKSISRQVTGIFMSMANQAFFSPIGGSVQKLPNSNLLVCSTSEGHLFEVTPTTNVVWEYICPVTTNGATAYKRDDWPLSNPVWRAARYGASHPALSGRTLIGADTIAGGAPSYISAPYIGGTTNIPASPTATNTVGVSAVVTNNRTVASVSLAYIVGAVTNTSAMTASGGVYTATIPAQPAGTLVRYIVSAKDDFDNTATDTLRSYMVEAGATNAPPVIGDLGIAALTGTAVRITARVTDDVSVASVRLYYATGAAAAATNTVFLETMATNPVKPWTGSGCDNPWTVAFNTANPFEQRGVSYGAGNTNCLEFKQGTANLTDSTITTVSNIDARGTAGTVAFWVQSQGLSSNAGWTFQLNAGTGFVTRLGELTAANHGWSSFQYALDSSERVSNLAMRFQFRGGVSTNRIDLDQISVKMFSEGTAWASVAMVDDGAHGDGAAGDGVYGASLPAQAAGTDVGYYIAADDGGGSTATWPSGAPGTNLTYLSVETPNLVLGRPTDTSIALNALAATDLVAYVEYGATPGFYGFLTATTNLPAAVPVEIEIAGLSSNAAHYYRLRYRAAAEPVFRAGPEYSFHTRRPAGDTFTFCIQGDSHPERVGLMFDADLYRRTLSTAAADAPDFYLTIGDDFGVDTIPTNEINQALVTERYTLQRPYLGLVGASAPLFLVNGNHEQAAAYLLDGTSNNIAVWAQNARNRYYPQPAPDGFYTGNTNPVPHVGLLRNYFAWTWGDALFVTIDPYWGSPVCPDNNYWTGEKRTNLWDVTHGDEQYAWLKKTLEESTATYKFVFAHHVMGTGRGGVELADLYEWGGYNQNGTWGFADNRPSWPLPIHQLMATNGVTIFFQGHDHLFAQQQLDGVTYLTLPVPADPTYTLWNSDAFTENLTYKTNGSGYARITVSPENVRVDYVRAFLPADEGAGQTNGMVGYSFTISSDTNNTAPVIADVTNAPAVPVDGSPTWVTARIADDGGVTNATLHVRIGSGVAVTNVSFLETMGAEPVSPWTGGGCDAPWTVTYLATNPFSQTAAANYGEGHTNGLRFTKGTTSFLNSMITSGTNIDARGTSGLVEFWLQTSGLGGTAGWAFLVNAGDGFVTQLGEMSGYNHAWQQYQYELAPSELVSNLQLRFQFRGGASSNQVGLDRLSVTTVTAPADWTDTPMYDDGAHGDGAAGDGVYGAAIPAQAVGTEVAVFVTAADGAGLTATNPAGGAEAPLSWVTGSAATYDVLLGRPTDRSIALSVLATGDLDVYGEFGVSNGVYTAGRSSTNRLAAGTPSVLSFDSLAPDTAYYYRLQVRPVGATGFSAGVTGAFHTQRSPTNSFTFAIEADPHYLDPNAAIDLLLWGRALTNIAVDAPDFLIDLGDTFMTEKLGVTNQSGAAQLCRDVRSGLFGPVGHSLPLFLVNGNHEAELGWMRSSPSATSNIAVWAAQERQRYFPCPVPGSFYGGATNVDSSMLAPRDSYYSFTWGGALFVVLDPFWETAPKPGSATCWNWTLGSNQYQWLQQTLSTNTSMFTFVFIHHLVGGSFDGQGRGGLAYAPYFEWGGYNTNDTWGFTTNRPGMDMPIQSLLLTNGVDAVFHGHDHLFVKEDLDANGDGITDLIYQECPQPSATNYNSTGTAAGYGYTNGVLQGSSGHLRVRVTPTNATVDYVRAYLPAGEGSGKTNGMVTYSYTITPVALLDAARSVSAPTSTDTVWVAATALGGTKVGAVSLVYDAGSGPVTVAMADDGAHGDGAAGDGRYGAQIPAFPGGTTVRYYLRVTDALGRLTTDPAGAPATVYSYTTTAAAAGWSMLYLPDTGQAQGYTATFGEDADYTIHAPAFTNHGDGTVRDLVTGLTWQQADGGEMTWSNAMVYASTNRVGGQSDWRLPTAHEAFSILNHGTVNPALNTNHFTLSTAQYWWTADPQVSDETRVWLINAGGGIGAHRQDETVSAGGTNRYHVRCVRGAARPSLPMHHFTNNLDGTITDLDTGLTWQQAATTATNWEGALQYAENLSLGGRADWRLPNVKELRSINDETKANPSVDTAFFTSAAAARHWSSTTVMNLTNRAWTVDFQLGLVSYDDKTNSLLVRCVRGGAATNSEYAPEFVLVPAGTYQMGDHFGFVDPQHPSDEIPVHTVYVDAFYMEKNLLTCREYAAFLNSAVTQGLVEVRSNYVYGVGGTNIYCDTYGSDTNSRLQWSGGAFTVRDNRDLHPVTGIRWFGAAAYCNWASARDGLNACYDLASGACDLTRNGYRLPTEAEWEYAARGGLYTPYGMFPWGSDTNADGTIANWAGKTNPYTTGPYPWTTPVGFYNGQLHTKAEFGWPGTNETYQTRDNRNGFGLYDMSGNVWEWINDWYTADYYTNCVINNVVTNPPGPAAGSPMPDGLPYRGLRGGNWFNGQDQYAHGRVANRDPSYFRGPGDPNGPWFHVGFRPVRRGYVSVIETGATLTQRASGLHFTESPAADAAGNVFFSDIPADTVYKWSVANQLSVFATNSGGANGLFFDAGGNLLACEGDNGRLVSYTPAGVPAPVTSTYGGLRYNEPNDLWIAPGGGVYFSDPVYFGHAVVQGGEHLYYLAPDRSNAVRVASDLVRPNGLVGATDGRTLYVADWGASNVYRYAVNADGTLTNRTAFAPVRCDGMTMDEEGNLYFTETDVLVYDSAGNRVDQIAVPERPTNVEFGGGDRKTLFVTTDAGSLYSIRMRVRGAVASTTTTNRAPVIASVAQAPVVPTSNDAVQITALVTDDVSVASATLYYSTGSGGGSGATNTVFLETMRTNAVKPWTGDGCVYPWTVTFTGGNPFEQRAGSNYGAGNTNGFEFKQGTATLTDSMLTCGRTIDARGVSGTVEFWLQSLELTGTGGWTFQLNSGTGFVTRLSELTGLNHGWQRFQYALAPEELSSNLTMRFQFRGGASSNRIDMDQISVKVITAGASWTNAPLYDDGTHGDGAAGDGVYGAQVAAQPVGTTVSYYLSATDGAGATALNPSAAPGTSYSYYVQASTSGVTQTVGLFLNDTNNAYPGYTLMAPMHHTNTYLLNNAGEYVHMWTSAYEPGRSAYLLENGHMIRACMIKQGGPSTGGGEGGRIEEYDWFGNLVWAIDYYSPTYIHHHDFKVLPNGNVLLLVAEKKTYAEVIAAGFNPALLDTSIVTQGYMLPDCLVEVTPTRPYGGTVVWEWHLWDHMIQDFDPTKANYGVVADHPELIDINGTGMKIPQFWNHVNGIDHNPQFDQVMLSIRGNSELFVIDHQLTTAEAAGHTAGRYGKGGDILYRWGNPAQYNRGAGASQILYQQHHTHWIEPGLPGAGDILIFNNGIGRGYSTIDQITPPVNATGVYALAAGAAYGPTNLAWRYTATPPTNFYSAEISGAQRLPNGNTLICSGIFGDLFEVTAAGQTVWRYICPVTTTILTQGNAIPIDAARPDQLMNAVFRVTRYPTNYVGLAGKDLAARGPIEAYAGVVTDTDGDGMTDAYERNRFGNLTTANAASDTDGDGAKDTREYQLGIIPTAWSSAGNGIPDGWALAFGFDPTLASVASIVNTNGFTTLQSYQADLNPTNPASRLAMLWPASTNGDVRLTWIGGSNAWQYLECTANLATNPWSVLYTNAPPTPLTNSVLHTGLGGNTNLFYRIKANR